MTASPALARVSANSENDESAFNNGKTLDHDECYASVNWNLSAY